MNQNQASQFAVDFVKNMVGSLLGAIDEGTKMAYQMLWHTLINFLSQHLAAVMVILILVFVIALAVYLKTGRWAMLGSVLYNYFYFGVLLVIGLIWGSDIFVSDFFYLAGTIILNPICYWIVRIILNKTGIRRA